LHSLHLAAFTGAPPELNPTEQVFGNLKSSELANLCRDTIAEVEANAETGLDRIGSDARLCFPFFVTPASAYDQNTAGNYTILFSAIG
jgi:putative transposase